jgi:hypothetical protein
MPRKDPAADLADALVRTLTAQREQWAAYPLTVRRLAELADPAAAPELVRKAVRKKPFLERALVVQPKDLDSPVALQEDAAALGESLLLLEYVLGVVCTPAKPTVEVGKLAAKVPKPLRPGFAAALETRLRDHTLPQGVAVVTVGKKQHLHPARFPLPLAPEEALARRLVQLLEERRQRGDDAYPVRLSELTSAALPPPSATVLKKALAHDRFHGSVLLAIAKYPRTPIAFRSDVDSLAESRLLLDAVLERCLAPENQTATIADAKKKVITALQPALEASLRRRMEAGTLPATVGWLWQKKKPLLFRLADVRAAAPPPSRSSSAKACWKAWARSTAGTTR